MKLLHDWVRQQTERRPDEPAVVCGDQRLTYADLEESSNRLARLLKASGCKRGDRVCFAVPKSPTAIIALLGIMKADCWHVPLDTNSPPPRAAKIVQSSQPRFVLGVTASGNFLEKVVATLSQDAEFQIGWLDNCVAGAGNLTPRFSWDDLQHCSPYPLGYENTPDDPAHILFTSGSTGEPKGVVITHANVIHFIEWAVRYFKIHPSDRLSCHSPLHFDLSYFDIFGAFSSGAQLHLMPREANLLPDQIRDFIRGSNLTQWFSVPSVLSYLAKFDTVTFGDFPSLKRLLWCGDVLSTPTLTYWMKRLPHVAFTNLYGPTETTIASSFYTIPACPTDDHEPIPIGTGCEGEELLVLNDQLEPVPVREIGNLYIKGVGLSPGYWRDIEKTSAAFLPYGLGGGLRIYRTGDLARVGDDGLVYFVGRLDSQIKCRGYRIELGEIEAALHSIGGLHELAVVAIPNSEFEGKLICCAYTTPKGTTTSNSELRSKLATLLPAYMLPSRWMAFETLPTNTNGKIDRNRLKELFLVAENKVDSPQRASEGNERGSFSIRQNDKGTLERANCEVEPEFIGSRHVQAENRS